jgi:hypothetical protein
MSEPPPCFLCSKPGVVPAIGRYDLARLGEGTIAMNLCERHAELLKDHVLTLRAEPPDTSPLP